jgi:hypothetical protein
MQKVLFGLMFALQTLGFTFPQALRYEEMIPNKDNEYH